MAEVFPGGVILALDWGLARVGVAACDPGRGWAYPVRTLVAGPGLWDDLAGVVAEVGPAVIVVGDPRRLDGTIGPAAENVRTQARRLADLVRLPVWLVDERMTTRQAQRRLHGVGRTVKSGRGVVDTVAAVGILESVLRALNEGHVIGQKLESEDACGETQ